MNANPFLGVFFHWLGGLASASFYIPYRDVKQWAWETYWLVGGFFSWIIAPATLAWLLVPDLGNILRQSPPKQLFWAYFFGALWGLGGITFGLTMRYLGIALGMAIALGYCAAFGTLMPPIFNGEISQIVHETAGQVILLGVAVCLAGIAVSGLAGMSKERELTEEQKKAVIKEFSFVKGILVATFSGVMSASFAYGLAAGKPIAELAKARLLEHDAADLWQNLPVLVVVLWGGFTTNFIWCVVLNIKNRTGHEYLALGRTVVSEISATEGVAIWDADQLGDRLKTGTGSEPAPTNPAVNGLRRGACPRFETMRQVAGTAAHQSDPSQCASAGATAVAEHTPVPLLSNYFFSAIAGITWYMQFFFYSMGQTRMGRYDFSSWTLHMASIIIFSTLWGVALREWEGTSMRTRVLIAVGLAVLIGSTIIVGYGNYLKQLGP